MQILTPTIPRLIFRYNYLKLAYPTFTVILPDCDAEMFTTGTKTWLIYDRPHKTNSLLNTTPPLCLGMAKVVKKSTVSVQTISTDMFRYDIKQSKFTLSSRSEYLHLKHLKETKIVSILTLQKLSKAEIPPSVNLQVKYDKTIRECILS